MYIFMFMFIYLFIYLFHVDIVKTSQKCDEAKVEQCIKKIVKDAPNREWVSRKRGQIDTSFLLNRDFAYYYGDFYFYYEKTIFAAMSTVFALVKERMELHLFKVYTRVLTVDFYWKLLKNFYPEHWHENFPCAMHLICFGRFLKECCS